MPALTLAKTIEFKDELSEDQIIEKIRDCLKKEFDGVKVKRKKSKKPMMRGCVKTKLFNPIVSLKRQIKNDVREIVGRYTRKHGLCPKRVRVKDQKHLWGSCSKDGTIHLNWHLVYAPKAVLEYAVLHELCHLKYRTHCDEFWGMVEIIMPDFESRKEWLDKNEHLMKVNVGCKGNNA